jgi:hypothetical protein
MQITRSSIDTGKAPAEWFTRDVYIDPVAATPAPGRAQANRVFFDPDEDHWHGAAPNRFMVHLALNEVDADHVAANWGDQVTDEEYAAAPASEH